MTRTRTSAALAVAVAAVAMAVVTGGARAAAPASVAPAAPAAEDQSLLLNHEHVDALAPVYEAGELSLRVDADLASGPDQLFDPGDVLFQLKDTADSRFELPDLPQYAFVGDPGDPIWLVPQTQHDNLVWAGWSTERLPHGVFTDDGVDLHLRDVQGPGRLEVFMDAADGTPLRVFSSTDPSYTTYADHVGWHTHANWVFTAPGAYTLTFEATATTVDGTQLSTGPVAYEWLVGAMQPTVALDAGGAAGNAVTLTARAGAPAVPEGGLPGTVAFLDGHRVLGEVPVAGGTASLAVDDLAAGPHRLTARFTPDPSAPHIGDALLPATSEPIDHAVVPDEPGPDPGPDPDPDPDECAIDVVLDAGHADVAARLAGDELRTEIKDGVVDPLAPVWRAPATVGLHVKPEAAVQVPSDPAFGFLGPAGSTVWQIPQTQDPALLWLGWNTEAIDYGRLAVGVGWHLDAVEGPGEIAVYQTGTFGTPQVLLDSSDPLTQTVELDQPTHAHGSWAFSAEGIYALTFRHTATLASGGAVSDTATVRVAVGDVDLDELCPGGQVPDPTDPPPPPPPSPSTTTTAPSGPNDPGASPTTDPGGRRTAVVCTTPTTRSSSAGSGETSSDGAVVLERGHVDYAARLVDGRLVSQVKDGTVAGKVTWRDPGDVTFRLGSAGEATVPAGDQFRFLGAAGSTIWQIPQTQDPDLVWLGWNTEEIATGAVSGPVTWRLDAVEGPGGLALYELGSFGQPTVRFASGDGAGDTFTVPAGTHAHGNWAFTAEGTYRVTFTHEARLASGATVRDTATVRFAVGGAGTSTTTTSTSSSSTSSTTGTAAADDCRMPRTGGDLAGMLLTGGLLVGAGSGCAAAGCRRRRTADGSA